MIIQGSAKTTASTVDKKAPTKYWVFVNTVIRLGAGNQCWGGGAVGGVTEIDEVDDVDVEAGAGVFCGPIVMVPTGSQY